MKKRGSGLGRKVSAPIAMQRITSDISCVALIITIAFPVMLSLCVCAKTVCGRSSYTKDPKIEAHVAYSSP